MVRRRADEPPAWLERFETTLGIAARRVKMLNHLGADNNVKWWFAQTSQKLIIGRENFKPALRINSSCDLNSTFTQVDPDHAAASREELTCSGPISTTHVQYTRPSPYPST